MDGQDSQRAITRRAGVVAAIGVVLALAAAAASYRLAADSALQEIAAAGQVRLAAQARALADTVARFEQVPFVLSLDPDVADALAQPGDTGRLATLDAKLARIAEGSRADAIYLTDAGGLTIAASNYDKPWSFVGDNYAQRPYVGDALATGAGRFYAIGLRSRVPGFYLSRSVGGAGVVVAKFLLDAVEREWESATNAVMVTDEHGIVILSSRAGWKYRALIPLSVEDRAAVIALQQYGDHAFPALGRLPGLRLSEPLPFPGWTIHYVADTRPATARATDAALAVGAVMAMGVLVILWLDQRRLRAAAEMRARAAETRALAVARDALEAEVAARTSALRATQDELVHAAKMAALGQMSAAIAHEVNQPLAAIRTYIASARLLIERGGLAEATANLGQIDDLVGRMAALTGELKVFARKSDRRREALPLSRPLGRAIALVEPRLRHDGVDFQPRIDEAAWVEGDELRLQQVFVNLLRNALDALQGRPGAALRLIAEAEGTMWRVSVEDNGPGIAGDAMGRLFDPFFTTKPIGEGLGLGLSISYGIVAEHGGQIRAENVAGGGARFIVELPALLRHAGMTTDG